MKTKLVKKFSLEWSELKRKYCKLCNKSSMFCRRHAPKAFITKFKLCKSCCECECRNDNSNLVRVKI